VRSGGATVDAAGFPVILPAVPTVNPNDNNTMTLILTESRPLRFFSFLVFYLAQGLPFGLVVIALPAFLAERDWGVAAIASFVAISQLPWSFKLLAGPLMDRYSWLSLGRRRPWVIFAQLALLLMGLAFVLLPLALDDATLLTGLCFLLMAFAAMQDVAVDGMAMDVLPVEEQGRANGFMALGQVLGNAGATLLCAFLLKSYGLVGVGGLLIVGFGLITLWSVLVRERPGEKLLPWTAGAATPRSLALKVDSLGEIGRNLAKVILLPASLLLMGGTFVFLMAHALWLTLAPIVVVQQLGYASTAYSSWTSVATLLAGVSGLAVGVYIDRRGIRLFYAVFLLLYAALALLVGLLQGSWSSPLFLLGVVFAQAFFYQGAFVCFIAAHMRLCWLKVAATQFSLYMAWVNLGRSLGPKLLSELQGLLAYAQVFLVIGGLLLLAIALLWLADLPAHQRRVAAFGYGQG